MLLSVKGKLSSAGAKDNTNVKSLVLYYIISFVWVYSNSAFALVGWVCTKAIATSGRKVRRVIGAWDRGKGLQW